MDELVEWYGQQLDTDERIARRAAEYDDGAAHDVDGPAGTWTCLDESEWFGPSRRGGVVAPRIGTVNAPELGTHIVRHDPARVLREVDAKRRTLERHAARYSEPAGGMICAHDGHRWPCPDVRDFAAVYADRPGYKESWRP